MKGIDQSIVIITLLGLAKILYDFTKVKPKRWTWYAIFFIILAIFLGNFYIALKEVF